MKRYFEKLQRFENNFLTALRSDYTRNVIVADRKLLNEIYNDLTGECKNLPVTCSVCWLDLLKKLGKLYFDYKEAQEAAQEQPKEVKPVEEVKEETEKPKRVRKKKVTDGDQ